MSIEEIVNSPEFTLSMEVYPPRFDDELSRHNSVTEKCKRIIDLHPAYLSVTHRAGNDFEQTLKICELAVKEGVPAVAHMRARDTGFEEARGYLSSCLQAGVTAIMPVTGDEYFDTEGNSTDKHCFRDSTDLTAFLNPSIEVLGTFYPEGSYSGMIGCIKDKHSLGANVFISQMVFNLDSYMNSYVNLVGDVVRVPGVLPILSEKSYVKQSSQVDIPQSWFPYAATYPVNDGTCGCKYAEYFIRRAKAEKVNHVHLFTMDNVDISKKIQEAVL